jgi:hypothetical protein
MSCHIKKLCKLKVYFESIIMQISRYDGGLLNEKNGIVEGE